MYTCPMHPEIQQIKPGHCPKCGMSLIEKTKAAKVSPKHTEGELQNSYKPLFVIIGLITLVTFIVALRNLLMEQFSWTTTMSNFMTGFFLVFSGFKLLDIQGFAQGYSTYDLLAKRIFTYGYIYPFLELTLGLLYAIHLTPPIINLSTFILMSFSGLGVAIKLTKHEKFHCACLGTFLKVPLTKVTLIEDFGMAAMALVMLVMR